MKRLFLFTLLFALISCQSEPYVIIQIADSQLGFTAKSRCQQQKIEYDNDVTYEAECLEKAVSLVNRIRPDAVIFTGDQVHHPLNEIEWNAFAEKISAIDKEISVFHLPGNHDVIIGENKVDLSPFSQRYGDGNILSLDKGVRVIGINSNYIKYNDPREAEQLEWLKKVLKKDKKTEVSLLFSHHPFFLNEVDEEDGYFQIQGEKRLAYMELFDSYGLDAMFAGHLHNNSEGTYNGIPVLTTTSVAYQINGPHPSIRVITVKDGLVSEELMSIE